MILPAAIMIVVSFTVRRKTKMISKNTMNSGMYGISKYPGPYTNVVLNNTAVIPAEIVKAIFPFPLAYQQTHAKKGETIVNPTQIIAYDFGKNPAINLEYR